MVDYTVIKFDERNLKLLSDPKERDKFRQNCVDINAINKAIFLKVNEDKTKILSGVKTIWGAKSTAYNYFNRLHIDAPPDALKTYDKVMKAYFRWERAEEQRKKSRAYRERQKMTAEELRRLGFEPGKDFEPGKAISFAKQQLGKRV